MFDGEALSGTCLEAADFVLVAARRVTRGAVAWLAKSGASKSGIL